MRKKVRKSLAFLLALALVVSVMSGLGLSVSADEGESTTAAVTEAEEQPQETPVEEENLAEEETPAGEGSGEAQAVSLYDRLMACTTVDEVDALLIRETEEEQAAVDAEMEAFTEEQNAALEAYLDELGYYDTDATPGGGAPGGGGGTSSSTSVDHIDIGVNVTVTVYNSQGKEEKVTIELTQDDAKKVDITAKQGDTTITNFTANKNNPTSSTGATTGYQWRIGGTYPVGTKNNPVIYTVTLEKTVTLDDGTEVSVTLMAEMGYWDKNNDCPPLKQQQTAWKNGSVISGSGIDLTFTNSSSNGYLTIQKTVAGYTLTEDKTYTFTIYKNTTEGEVYKDDVEVEVKKDSTTATTTLTGVPWGTYCIVEKDAGKEIDGYTVETNYTFQTVEISAGENSATATFLVTNTYTPNTKDLTIQKKITVDGQEYNGNDFASQSYTFTVQGPDAVKNQSYSVGSDSDVKFNSEGETTVTVMGATSKTITGLPIGDYTVTETEPTSAPLGYQYVDNESSWNTDDNTVTITNNYRKVGDLTITKAINVDDGAYEGTDFDDTTFTFTVTKQNDSTFSGTYNTNQADKTVTFTDGVATVPITGAGSITINDLPVGSYTVTETTPETTPDKYEFDAGNSTTTADATVSSSETATATITNAYTTKTFTVTVKKVVTGNMGSENDEFAFNVTNDSVTADAESFNLTGNTKNDANQKTFTVKYGESFTVIETQVTGYTLKSVAVNESGSEGNLNSTTYTINSVTADTTITFTNDKTINPPSGVTSTIAPYAIMAVLAAGAGVYFVYSRRQRD